MEHHRTAPHNQALRMLPHGCYDDPRLYAIHFKDGRVKIGFTRAPRNRALQYTTGKNARPIHRFHLFGTARGASIHATERLALSLAAQYGERIGTTEYFSGLAFQDALMCVRKALDSHSTPITDQQGA